MRRTLYLILLAAAIILPINARADEVLVSAAASLTDALNEIGKAYTGANPHTIVRFNFGASGALQQQILQGAPVDVFASASPKEMDALEHASRIAPGTRVDFASNRLVLIAPLNSKLKHWDDLRSASVSRVAISNPDSVPSGRYARETLTKRGLWDIVQPKAIFGENVRQTLTYVSGGNVDAGIVFSTDQQIEARRVRIVDTAIPGKDHSPIVYPAAVISSAANPSAARKFVLFLHNKTAQSVLKRYGFLSVRPGDAPRQKPASPTSNLKAPQTERR